MSNVIEEFVIKFLTDSKDAKKGANDLDKFLDNFNKNRHRKDLKEHETFLKNKKKLDDKYYKGSGTSSPRSPNKPTTPSTPRNPQLTKEQIVAKAIEDRQEKELKRELDIAKVQKNAAAMKKASELSQRKEMLNTRKNILNSYGKENKELKSMSAYYKEIEKRGEKLEKGLSKQVEMIHRTAGFKLADRMGEGDQYRKEIQGLVSRRDLAGLRDLRYEMTNVRQNMSRYQKEIRKTNIAQKGLTDSTRNMIRSYASLYAIFEGTTAIKRVGQDFQGMEASMLAASGSSEAAAKDMMFINGIVDEMGLSLKDTTDAFVKFKFASKGKISQQEQEDLFSGLSMFGTALKVDDESMKRSQKALIQIDDYCLAA